MTSDGAPWRRWQLLAVCGLLVFAVLGVTIAGGVWLAELVGLPPWLGWIAGAVVGYLCAQAIMRRAVDRLMA